MLATPPQYQVRTIVEYAQYVLDDPRVKAFIQKFKTFQAVADKVMDSFEGMVDAGQLVFKSTEELEMARSFSTRIQQKAKNDELNRMIQNEIVPPEWRFSMDRLWIQNLVEKGADKPHPNFTDIPLVMFFEFAQDRAFSLYLYNDSLPFLNGTYFSQDMDLARQRYLVFAVYLWTRTNAKSTFDVKKDNYYEPAKPIDIQARWQFLTEFKNFIHLDVWDSTEYKQKQKKGIIMRLRLATRNTGSVVIQQCEERNCNTIYMLGKEGALQFLRDTFLNQVDGNNGLQKLGLFFQCRHCQKETASMYSPLSKEAHFYCDQLCFNNCCDGK